MLKHALCKYLNYGIIHQLFSTNRWSNTTTIWSYISLRSCIHPFTANTTSNSRPVPKLNNFQWLVIGSKRKRPVKPESRLSKRRPRRWWLFVRGWVHPPVALGWRRSRLDRLLHNPSGGGHRRRQMPSRNVEYALVSFTRPAVRTIQFLELRIQSY